MYLQQVLNEDGGCASYFIASHQTNEAAVIDPWYGEGGYLDIAKERGFHIFYIIDTAVHLDHASGNRRVAMTAGGKVYVHEAIDTKYRFQPLTGGQVITMGEVQLEVLHTPGRGPESISVLLSDTSRGPEPFAVFSGDSLFVGDPAQRRWGGPHGTPEEYDSIQKLLQLPDFVAVLPAHYVGQVGRPRFRRPTSTIGYERRYNPLLSLSREEFLKLGEQKPFRPLNSATIEEMNRGRVDQRWARNTPRESVAAISAGSAPAWVAENRALVVDVREPAEYAAGHIPGAISIPMYEIGERAAEIPTDQEVLLVCAAGLRSERSCSFLKTVGLTQVTNLEGGTGAWRQAGHPVNEGPQP